MRRGMYVGKVGSYTVCGPGTDPWIRVKKLLDSERLPNISVQGGRGGRGSVNKQGEFNRLKQACNDNNGNFICVFECTIVNLATYRQFTNAAWDWIIKKKNNKNKNKQKQTQTKTKTIIVIIIIIIIIMFY